MKSQNGVRIKTQLEHPIIGKDIFKKKKKKHDQIPISDFSEART